MTRVQTAKKNPTKNEKKNNETKYVENQKTCESYVVLPLLWATERKKRVTEDYYNKALNYGRGQLIFLVTYWTIKSLISCCVCVCKNCNSGSSNNLAFVSVIFFIYIFPYPKLFFLQFFFLSSCHGSASFQYFLYHFPSHECVCLLVDPHIHRRKEKKIIMKHVEISLCLPEFYLIFLCYSVFSGFEAIKPLTVTKHVMRKNFS